MDKFEQFFAHWVSHPSVENFGSVATSIRRRLLACYVLMPVIAHHRGCKNDQTFRTLEKVASNVAKTFRVHTDFFLSCSNEHENVINLSWFTLVKYVPALRMDSSPACTGTDKSRFFHTFRPLRLTVWKKRNEQLLFHFQRFRVDGLVKMDSQYFIGD